MGKIEQLHAGYILEGVVDSIEHFPFKENATEAKDKFRKLLTSLSYFDLQHNGDYQVDQSHIDPRIAVLSNMVSRGLPTLAPIDIEEQFSSLFGKTQEYVQGDGNYKKFEWTRRHMKMNFTSNELVAMMCSLYIVDPLLKTSETDYFLQMDARAEQPFYRNILPKVFTSGFEQLFDVQADIHRLVNESVDSTDKQSKQSDRTMNKQIGQNVDFSFEFPFEVEGYRGIIIEIDGSQHQTDKAQFIMDKYRDRSTEAAGFATIRIPTKLLTHHDESYIIDNIRKAVPTQIINSKLFAQLGKNINEPLFRHNESFDPMQLMLCPFAIARLHKVILNQISAGVLSLDKDKWRIGVFERDVPCASLAISSLNKMLESIFHLANNGQQPPKFDLMVYSSHSFAQSAMNKDVTRDDHSSVNSYRGDLLIDISMLQRTGHSSVTSIPGVTNCVTIRSSHSMREGRRFQTTDLLSYDSLIDDIQENNVKQKDASFRSPESESALLYFLQSIFRLKGFRPGQVEIINHALKGKSTLGLLPTGGGKSLTYQFCVLMQPGSSLVVAPIISLMQDQEHSLKSKFIDCCACINSTIKTQDKVAILELLKQGGLMFTIITPERFQIRDFRSMLLEMHDDYKVYGSYCVIDEAHCVSEWGHDFRTAYLRLGKNIKEFFKCKSPDNVIPILGLTATASYDVLSDVKRELQLSDESIVNRSNKIARAELSYNIFKLEPIDYNSDKELKVKTGEAKLSALRSIINTLPEKLGEVNQTADQKNKIEDYNKDTFYELDADGYKNAVLIFCPHVSEYSTSGVEKVYNNLAVDFPTLSRGMYHGKFTDKENHQKAFLNNEQNVFVATKAFGMGIDKSNVRSTVHFNYPQSIEGFVQEAGRAGRDQKVALCNIIYCAESDHDKGINLSFHSGSFKGLPKELLMCYELLDEVSYPAKNRYKTIDKVLEDEFSIIVSSARWNNPKTGQPWLYINTAFQCGYGAVSLDGLYNKNIRTATQDNPDVILDYVVNYLKKEKPDDIPLDEWIEEKKDFWKEPGIEKKLELISVGDEIQGGMLVGFENDRKLRICEALVASGIKGVNEKHVDEASQFTRSLDGFLESLSRKCDNFTKITDKVLLDKLELLFNGIRTEQDTFKAIFRLTILGIIDDYEIDYNSGHILLKVVKKSEEEYTLIFRDYLMRYLSKERVDSLLHQSDENKPSGLFKQYLDLLVEFTYKEIADKRVSGIRMMENICESCHDKGSDYIANEIDLYFNAKYIDAMRFDSDNGKSYSEEFLWKYLDKIKGNIDNINHVRGSSYRLLVDSPNNPALKLMSAFSLFCLETKTVNGELVIHSQKLIDKASEEFIDGIKQWRSEKETYLPLIEGLRSRLYAYDQNISKVFEPLYSYLSVNVNREWLSNFNTSFLKGIDHG